jgi:FMN phosphatase YigB (HAD superfamily)
MNNRKYVFDLDNTLIYTDKLNTISYNYALDKFGLPQIESSKRITRDTIFEKHPEINMTLKNKIIEAKQNYFIENLHITSPNRILLELLMILPRGKCILWTKANEKKVQEIMKFYKIEDEFKMILFSSKSDIALDLGKIYEAFECRLEQIMFFEDDKQIINKLRRVEARVISV